jgi:hypothetical protein
VCACRERERERERIREGEADRERQRETERDRPNLDEHVSRCMSIRTMHVHVYTSVVHIVKREVG